MLGVGISALLPMEELFHLLGSSALIVRSVAIIRFTTHMAAAHLAAVVAVLRDQMRHLSLKRHIATSLIKVWRR